MKREKDLENKKLIEAVQIAKEGAIKAKERIIQENIQVVSQLSHEMQERHLKAKKEAQEERLRKTEIIHQIKLLEKNIPAVGTYVKDVDLTETSGFGLLGEMSVLELQERLVLVKLKHKQAQDVKRQEIANKKKKQSELIDRKLEEIDKERDERRSRRVQKTLPDRVGSVFSVRSDVSTSSIKELLFEKDPSLRNMQARIDAKRSGTSSLITARISSQGSKNLFSGSTSPHKQSRPTTAMSEKWCELDEAERAYTFHKRELGKHHKEAEGIPWMEPN